MRNILVNLGLGIVCCLHTFSQSNFIDFNSIPKKGTILIYTHQDDDAIFMLPFWSKSEKFIDAAMPTTPGFKNLINLQQDYMDINGYDIQYETNFYAPWGMVSNAEYRGYYWGGTSAYDYLAKDHVIKSWSDKNTERIEINKIKAKIEHYIADPEVDRIITHNNWGEYGHQQHVAVNIAVRELAVKYRKDVWMLGCEDNNFVDIEVPSGIHYTLGNFDSTLFNAIRKLYLLPPNWWTWSRTYSPTGNHKFIKIVEEGNDLSFVLRNEKITYPGDPQYYEGSYILDGTDDYLTLEGNNNTSFTIALKVRPERISEMGICKMAEYPTAAQYDRCFELNANGTVSAMINDGLEKIVTSDAKLLSGVWNDIAMTSDGVYLKLYLNGILDKTISAGVAISNYSSPEFVLGMAKTPFFFAGQIAEPKLFNQALSENEIASLCDIGLTVFSYASEGGTITPAGYTSVQNGQSLSFSITPHTGYHISEVKLDNVSIGVIADYTFENITESHTIRAYFEKNTFTITSNAETGGSISPEGQATVAYGTSKTYSITADKGFEIKNLFIDGVKYNGSDSYTFTNVTTNHTISVSYLELPLYRITTEINTGGTITPDKTIVLYAGGDTTLRFSANEGYKIEKVLLDGADIGNSNSLTFRNLQADHSVAVTFSPIVYTILSISSNTKGAIYPSGITYVTYGSDLEFTILPVKGYKVGDIHIDSQSKGPANSYAFHCITMNHSIEVTFVPMPFNIISGANSGGLIYPNDTTFLYGSENLIYTIVPFPGYLISTVYIDGVDAGPIPSYIFYDIQSNHSIFAEFTPVYTGTTEFSDENIEIYPVPFSNTFNAQLNYKNLNECDIKMFDITGRLIFIFKDLPANSTSTLQTEVPPGVYIMKIFHENELLSTLRVIKE